MAHIHPIIDSEPHFIIDTVTRQIINKEKKKRLIQGDHDSERFTFELPREVEGHLMTEVTSCKVHYINIDKYDKELTSKSFFPVTDLKVEGDTVTFSWLISGVATKYYGTINFIIEFECVLDGEINYVWQTDIYRGFPVQESFSNSEYIFEEYYDVIEQWGKEVFAKVGKVKTVNGIEPDDNGNVPLDFLDTFPRGLSVEGGTDNNARVVLTDVNGDTINSFNISGNENVTVKSDEKGIELEVADSTEVVQGIGVSETAVMSQKAVTESLEAVRSEMPEIPVQSVNGKTGEVKLNAADVGADTSGAAALAVSEHNTNTETHGDIRIKLEGVIQRLNALANSDDTTLDQLYEIVAYIKANRGLIESVTSSKLGVDDIINNLTTNVSNKPLSAAQGVALKTLIDKLQTALDNIKIPTKVSELTNDLNFAMKSEVPTKTSDLTDDVGYINQETFNNHKHYWRQIIDRPFGEFPTEETTDTVVSDDKVYGTMRWVSDVVPKFEDLNIGGSISYYNVSNGVITGELQTITFPQGDYTIASSDNGLIIRSDGVPMIVISFNGNPKFGAVTINDVNETGIFFDQGKHGKCIHSLKLNGYTGFKVFEKRKLGKEWLPEDIGAVKTVNYIKPDPNGNINIEGGSGTESNAFELIQGDTLVWNGNTEGKSVVPNSVDPASLSYVRVSSAIPTLAELQNGGTWATTGDDGVEYEEPFTSDNIVENGNLIVGVDGYFLVAKEDNVQYIEGTDINVVLPKAGIYFIYFGADGYMSRLSVTDYTGFTKSILKMESLTLHQHDWYGKAVVGGNTVRGDETLQGKWVKVSDEVPTEAEINNGGVVRYYNVTDDVISDELITGYYPSDDYVVTVKDEGITIRYGLEVLVIISFNGSSSIGGVTFEGIDSPGVYFKQLGYSCVHSFTINGYTKFSYNVEKIPIELLPTDYIKQLVKEVIEEIVGTDTDGLKDINGDVLYDILQNKLIIKE